jgi:hypothetical protein
MSTSTQVYADFDNYVGCYITAQLSTTPQSVITQLYNNTISFSSVENDDGSFSISNWNVPNVTQPQLSDLETITPATDSNYKLTYKITILNLEYPDIGIILLDLYSQISLLKGGSAYTYTTLLAYLQTLLPS